MKDGWQTKSLRDVCDFQRGLTYGKGDEVDQSDNIVLRATNIDLATNQLNLSELRYINDEVIVPASKKIIKDSLIVCTASGSKSHLGKVALIEEDYDFAFGGFMGQLTPRGGLVPKYLFHLMTSGAYKDFIASLSDGANINNLKFDDLGKFEVPFPDESEQKRIVAILDEAFAGIATAKANAERNLGNAREVFDNARQELFSRVNGNNETSLGDEIELLVGFAFKSSGYVGAGDSIRLLRGDNIVQGSIRWDEAKHWPADDVGDYGRYALREGDVVLAMDRPWVKAGLKRALLQELDVPALLVQRTACLRAGPRLDNRYLFQLISANDFSRHLLDVQTGSGVPHISGQQIKDFNFALPPIAEQRRIVGNLDKLQNKTQRLESIYTRKLTALDELKQSLLHQAFSGKL